MIEKVKSDKIALKPNKLILAGQQMLPYQQRLFLAALSVLEFKIYNDANYGKINDWLNNSMKQFLLSKTEFRFPAEKIFENYKGLKLTDNANFKKDIEKKTSDIVRQVLFVKDEKSFKAINIMDYAEYRHEEKMIHIQFSKAILPILFEMFEEGFTKIHLISFMKLRSSYSMRLYEILMYAKNLNMYKNGYTLSLKDLYFFFGIDRDKEYKEYKHFKSMILLRCRKEIKEKTGLSFDFEEIKKGAKVDAIKFMNIKENPNFDKTTAQISLFEKEEVSEKEIILSSDPTETFLLDVLENPKEYIFSEQEDIKIDNIQTKLLLSEAEIIVEEKFTSEQLEKLDKYLDGFFSADEIKEKYDFDYIEFYYNKANEKNDKGTLKDFAGFLYSLLVEDKHKFYELKSKEQEKKLKEIERKRIEKEKKAKAKEDEKIKKAKEKKELIEIEKIFASLDEEKREMYLKKVYSTNSFLAELDKDKEASIIAKMQVVAMIKNESN